MEQNLSYMNLLEELSKDQSLSNRQVRGRFISVLSQIVNNFDDEYTLSEILHIILEWKSGFDYQNPREWSDEKMLKRIEELYKQLLKEAQSDKYGKG